MRQIDYTITLDHDIGLYIAEIPEIKFAAFGLTAERALWELIYAIDLHNTNKPTHGLDLIEIKININPESWQIVERGNNQYLYFKSRKQEATTREQVDFVCEYALYFGCPLYYLIGNDYFPSHYLMRVKNLDKLQVFESRVKAYITFDWQEISANDFYSVSCHPIGLWHTSDLIQPNSGALNLGTGVVVDDVYFSVTEKFLQKLEQNLNAMRKQRHADTTLIETVFSPTTATNLKQQGAVSLRDCIDMIIRGDEYILTMPDFTGEMLAEIKQKLGELGYLAPNDAED